MTTTSTTREPGTLLKRALKGNVIFSAVSAIAAMVGAGPLGDFFHVDPWIMIGAGIGLAGWAVLVWSNARRSEPQAPAARITVAGDLLWTLAAVVLTLTDLISLEGKIVLLVSGVATLDFAIVQVAGIKRLTAGG